MRYSGILILLACAVSPFVTPAVAEDLNVLPKGANNLLYKHLLQQSKQLYAKRASEVETALQSPGAVRKRGERLLREYLRIIGQLPNEKTPLNAVTTGIIECDGYRIEKVVFQSRPNLHVTANLYIPTKGKGPFPGVAMPCGHSSNGKASEAYQSACALLALNGFVALIYDPICQGERHQLLKAPRHGTTTHAMLNAGSLLVGRSVVGYEAWDGIRSIDYLLSRSEVDRNKPVGLTGNSGGGTQTNFLMALDDRVGPAAPSCYVMRKQRKYETIGPADGCQDLPGEVALGIDHIDYFWMRAPKPTLILAAEKDFFEFKSTKNAADEANRLYTALGKPEQTGLFSFNDKHGFSKPRRQAAVLWMKRWLMNDTKPVIEPNLTLQADKALRVSKTGQVITTFKDEATVWGMNLGRAKDLAEERRRFWNNGDRKTCLAEVKRLIGSSEKREKPTAKKTGTIDRDGYKIEKLNIQCVGGIPMPALLFVPDGDVPKRPAAVYVDGRGKARDAAPGGEVDTLVRSGRIVLSIDVVGFGETADRGSNKKYYDNEHRVANLALHIGRPLLGQRVDHVLTAADVLAERDDVGKIDLVGVGRAGPVVLHAAALDERFSSVTMRESIDSWMDDVVGRPLDHDLLGHVVPGALLKYDLPDLLRAIAPREVNVLRKK